MRPFTRLLDLVTLRSEKPIRRLLAYYVLLAAVVFALSRFVPVIQWVAEGVGLAAADSAQQLLQDGLAGTGGGIGEAPAASSLELLLETIQVMFFSLALMLPVSWVFMSARRAASFDQSIVQTLLILPLVVAGIVVVVQTSLALAFSLAGIVAALRLRPRIRDVRDTVYLFLGIGVGLAVGVHAVIVAAVLTVTFNVVVLLIWRYDFGRKVLEPTANAQWSEPLGDIAGQDEENAVPDRDLILALSPQRAAVLAKRFRRISKVLGTSKRKPRYNAILTVTTKTISEAQVRIEKVLDTMTRRWRLDEVASHNGKPAELYYLVRIRKSVSRDQFLTALRESAGPAIETADVEIGDALAQEQEQGEAA